MKKIGFIALFAATLLCLNKSYGQITEMKAGLSLATMRAVYEGENMLEDQLHKPGYYIAIMPQFPMNERFTFRTGISFISKGLKLEDSDSYFDGTITHSYYSKTVANLNYLEIPIQFQFTTPLAKNFNLLLISGPYIGTALSGKVKSEYSYNGDVEKDEERVNFGRDDSDDLRRLDLGMSFGLGFEFYAFILDVNYNL
jgi:hypothetical protein